MRVSPRGCLTAGGALDEGAGEAIFLGGPRGAGKTNSCPPANPRPDTGRKLTDALHADREHLVSA